jgi:hypothetical protein
MLEGLYWVWGLMLDGLFANWRDVHFPEREIPKYTLSVYNASQKFRLHFFCFESRVLKLHNIKLIRLYIWIAEICSIQKKTPG